MLLTARQKRQENTVPFSCFFVNGSGQFCGVAEMIGPVDFDKSFDYWQNNRWSGQFPVKWQIVKDVPNNIVRHTILENNEKKPVTNSKDAGGKIGPGSPDPSHLQEA